MNKQIHSPLDLDKYLEVAKTKYEACLDALDKTYIVDGVKSSVRFHYVKFDANGEPKTGDLAKCLADHVIEYCLSVRRRGKPATPTDHSRLNREARALFRKCDTSGEAGEMLLYFLLEAVLDAPQMVAKMELKTNPNMEIHGSDGIHMKWHEADGLLDIFFSESKLHAAVGQALTSAFESMEALSEDKMLSHEFGIVTSHYKWADDRTKSAVLRYSPNRC